MLKLQFTEKNNITNKFNSGLFLLAAVFIALSLRFYDVSNRPLHNDEAVNTIKFQSLLEQNEYKYDPIEYHGPTLYYATLVAAWVYGVSNFEDLNEKIIRSVPIFFTLLLFLALFSLRKNLSIISLIVITLFLIISPYINFYSRYYIHESLFVTFTFFMIITFLKFYNTSKNYWIILSGLSAGLLFATKETSVIVFFSFLIAIIFTKTYKVLNLKSISHFGLSFLVIAVIFYSSFFSYPKGIIDSVLTFKNYFIKSSVNTEHVQPWFYYLKLLSYNSLHNILISEAVILLLGFVGIIFSFLKNSDNSENILFRFLSIFSIVGFVIFSIISYKTPWNIFYLWIGFIFLAGYGFSNLYYLQNNKLTKYALSFFFSLALIHLVFQMFLTSYKLSSDPENPYTYSQPTEEIYSLTNEVEKIILFKKEVLINVIAADNQYWPLPWYFRKAKNVAWNFAPPNDIYRFEMIIAQPNFTEEITDKLYTLSPAGEKYLYIPLIEKDISIRPGNFFSSYIRNDLYQKFINTTNIE